MCACVCLLFQDAQLFLLSIYSTVFRLFVSFQRPIFFFATVTSKLIFLQSILFTVFVLFSTVRSSLTLIILRYVFTFLYPDLLAFFLDDLFDWFMLPVGLPSIVHFLIHRLSLLTLVFLCLSSFSLPAPSSLPLFTSSFSSISDLISSSLFRNGRLQSGSPFPGRHSQEWL